MELKQQYTSYFNLVAGKEISEEMEEEFAKKLELLMNEYEIFKLDAALNPFSKQMYIK